MVRVRLLYVGLPVVGLITAGLFFLLVRHYALREPERWFVPGEWGHEAGRRGQAPAALAAGPAPPRAGPAARGGFLTRVLGVDAEWGRRNQLTEALPFSHNLGNVFPPALAREHPEFFPLADGQRLQPPPGGAWFWNPDLGRVDVALHAAEAARRHFAVHPAAPSFALGVNDALIWGESPEMLALIRPGAWFRERPDYSNLVFTFMNRAAAELARTHPQKYLGALAYYWAENAPDFPLHPQVIPFLTADRAQGYDREFRAGEFQLQERWGKAAGVLPAGGGAAAAPASGIRRRLGLYDYLYGHGYLIPRIHTQLLAENLRQARRAGFTDYYAEMNPNWGLDGPMPWLTAQLLQDPEQPARTLLDEYYRRYFERSAAPMRAFFERAEELWMQQPGPPYWLKHYRNESQAVIFPLGACGGLRAHLDAAARLAETEKVRQRVGLVSAAFGVTERFVAFHEARDRLARRALAPPTDAPALAADLKAYLGHRGEFIRYTTELRRERPLAVAAFGWDDYLKNDPVAAALLAWHAAEAQRPAGAGAARPQPPAVETLTPFAPDQNPLRGNDSSATALWAAIRATGASGIPAAGPALAPGSRAAMPGRELLRDPGMAAELKPARKIAGMDYGIALPADWFSQVEPSQFHRAELIGPATARVLRISGSKDTTVSQWDPLGGAGLHRARFAVRGRVSTGTAVSLVFAWLDEKGRHVGFKGLRLPDGDWPGWVTLQQAGTPPAGAVWVGIGLRVQNQVPGDWIEAREFSLQHFPTANSPKTRE
jgi:hypothetical protein